MVTLPSLAASRSPNYWTREGKMGRGSQLGGCLSHIRPSRSFSAGESWGRFSQRLEQGRLHWQIVLLGGQDLTLQTVRLRHEGAPSGSQTEVTVAGVPCPAQTSYMGQDVSVTLDAPATLTPKQILLVVV